MHLREACREMAGTFDVHVDSNGWLPGAVDREHVYAEWENVRILESGLWILVPGAGSRNLDF